MADNEHLVAGLHSRGVLPHLKREGGTYFVTFRQAGTLPKEVLLRFKQERAATAERERATLQNAVTATDQQIDALVYELYDLTEKEIKLVEGNA